VFYVDNGPGFRNNLQKDEVIGMAARLGYTVLHSIPYNSQARGVIERFHGSVLKPLANRFASSVDKHVSKVHKAKVQKLVTLEERRRGLRSPAPTWDEFIAALEQAFAEYNGREHRALARGSVACTPAQRWEQLTAEGWQVARLPVDAEPDLFWPREVRQVTNRGELRLFGRSYFNTVLAEYEGEKVLVSYDQHCDARVIVRDLDQRFICEAVLEGNRRPYMPASVIEAAREKSLETAVKRAQRRVDQRAEDLAHFRTIEHQPAEPARFVDIVPAAPAAEERPVFHYQTDRYEWLMGHRDRMTDDDRAWCKRFAASELYQQLVERWQMLGIAWPDDGVEPGFRAAD
jgi:putative transposase